MIFLKYSIWLSFFGTQFVFSASSLEMCNQGNIGVCDVLQKSELKAGRAAESEKIKQIKCSFAGKTFVNSYIAFIIDCPGEEEKALKLCDSEEVDLDAQFSCEALALHKNDKNYNFKREQKRIIFKKQLNEQQAVFSQPIEERISEANKKEQEKNTDKLAKSGVDTKKLSQFFSYCIGFFEAKLQTDKASIAKALIAMNKLNFFEDSRDEGKNDALTSGLLQKTTKFTVNGVESVVSCEQITNAK